MNKPDGGYAFPLPLAVGPAGDVHEAARWSSGGMTLRDYFAAQALAALPFRPGDHTREGHRDAITYLARNAYAVADAMLAERAK